MNLFFYRLFNRLRGTAISKALIIIIGVIGFFSGIASWGTPGMPLLIWLFTVLAAAPMLLCFCHFKNQEKMLSNADEIILLLKRINKNTKAAHEHEEE